MLCTQLISVRKPGLDYGSRGPGLADVDVLTLPFCPLCGLRVSYSRGHDVYTEGQSQWHLHGFWGVLHHWQHGVHPTERHHPALHPLLHCYTRPLEVLYSVYI